MKAVQICSELVLCCLNKADAPQIFLSGCLQDTQEYFVYFKCTADSMAENMQADACEGDTNQAQKSMTASAGRAGTCASAHGYLAGIGIFTVTAKCDNAVNFI